MPGRPMPFVQFPMSSQWYLGMAIRTLRERQGVELLQLAKRTGLDLPYLTLLDKGKRLPSFANIDCLLRVLGVNWHEFIDLVEQQPRPLDPPIAILPT